MLGYYFMAGAFFGNISDWMEGTEAQSPSLSRFPLSDLPGTLHAFLVLLASIVALGAA